MVHRTEEFGPKEKKLMNALYDEIIPDFVKAKEALDEGADINASDKNGNILEQILFVYGNLTYRCPHNTHYECEDKDCEKCEHFVKPQKEIGEYMLDIICFFIDNGFDVGADEGRYGANCIRSLIFSTIDEYELIAAKMLLDAGAIDVKDKDGVYVIDDIAAHTGEEEWYFNDFDGDISIGKIYDAMYQIVLAKNEGRDYSGIEYCERITGKKISHVYAQKAGNEDIFFTINTKNSYHPDSYNTTLYFEFDEGFLFSTKYQECWIDKKLPTGNIEDVSDKFRPILGRKVTRFQAYHKASGIGLSKVFPVVNIYFDNGLVLQMTTNFGETDEEEYIAAYFRILNKHNLGI